MNKSTLRKRAQSGFTLIELIVVIVILGILAATALPKFTSLSGDARVASVQAAKGALAATAAMVKGKFLVGSSGTTSVDIEGTTVTFTANGYPVANAAFAAAAGLADDYQVLAAGAAATTSTPAVPANSIAIVPKSLAGSPTGLLCYLIYTQPASATTAPTYVMSASVTNCS